MSKVDNIENKKQLFNTSLVVWLCYKKSDTLSPSTRCRPIATAQLPALFLTDSSGWFLYSSNNAIFFLKIRKKARGGKNLTKEFLIL